MDAYTGCHPNMLTCHSTSQQTDENCADDRHVRPPSEGRRSKEADESRYRNVVVLLYEGHRHLAVRPAHSRCSACWG